MKKFKSLLAVILVLLLMFSFTGCIHKQNEIAVEVGNTKFTAAQYSYALLMADSEAQSLVDEQLKEAGTDTSVTAVDYYAQKIEDTDYVTWVENRAIEMLSEYAAYEQHFTEAGLTLDDEAKSEIESYAEYYYPYYQAVYEANGIAKETYIKMLTYDIYADEYFTYLYGKEGSKEIPAEDVNKAFSESYRIALVLQTDVTEMEEADLNNAKADLEHYKEHLEKGESIVDVYNEFNGLSEETAETGNSPAEDEADVVSILADPEFDSGYGIDFWTDVKDITAGKAQILEAEQDGTSYLRLVYIVEIAEDDTSYVEQMDANIRWVLKNEEFKADISAFASGMNVVKNKYAMSAFKVKDIDYGE